MPVDGAESSSGGARRLGLARHRRPTARTAAHLERDRVEHAPVLRDQDQPVTTGRVGAEYAEATWKRFPPAPTRRAAAGEQVFESTGHTLRAPFLAFWQAAGGLELLGAPISEPAWELTASGRRLVQYFERGRLERDPQQAATPDEIAVSDLGQALAALRGVDTTPAPNQGYATAGPPAPPQPDVGPLRAPEPAPAAPAPAPAPAERQPPAEARALGGEKTIVVNLSDQWLYAYDGDEQVFSAPVSSGRDGMNTPTGTFAIYAKLKLQTMDGVTEGEYWVVPDVPNVMYFTGGVALHGTYWHNRFGTGARLSHGCVNLPLKSAAWLYAWAPVGTTVRVTY